MLRCQILCFLGLIVLKNCQSFTELVTIEAEMLLGDLAGTTHRGRASGDRAVHLYAGDTLYTELCFMSNTDLDFEVFYSNDGGRDRIEVTLDTKTVGEFTTEIFSDGGRAWDRFKSSGNFVSNVTEGRYVLAINVLQTDVYGVEIDSIELRVNNSQTLDSLRCTAFCFDDIVFPNIMPNLNHSSNARAVQRSVTTKCAEEDNVNIPVFHDNANSFIVTASMPKYRSFQNNRGPDWTDCKMATAFWNYRHVNLGQGRLMRTDTSVLDIHSLSPKLGDFSKRVTVMDITFELEGPITGSTDSEVGTVISLNGLSYKGTLELYFQYLDRYGNWSPIKSKMIQSNTRNVVFETPDFSFREGTGNKIRIEIYSSYNTTAGFYVEEISMTKRSLKADRVMKLYDDDRTVVDGVDIDMWWRINETMNVTISGINTPFYDIDYIRIAQRVPWSDHAFSQNFVLYQDGNIRLLPPTPHGLDWIPFGSSVILGQTEYPSNRPSAPISYVDINPKTLDLRIFYNDGGSMALQIVTSIEEVQLRVSESHYARDSSSHPFFTFRSMYVTDGNSDVDHVSVDGGEPKHILGLWQTLTGNYFAFHRKCISNHNTLSPDISILIN